MDEEKTTATSLEGFFGLNSEAVMHLLIPYRQNLERFGGKILLPDSSPVDIAINILELCNKLTSQGIAASRPIYLN